MKQTFSILLILGIFLNSTGYVGVFYYFQKHIKKEMKTSIKNSLSDLDVEFLEIHVSDKKYRKFEKKEFFYGDKLYDVIQMKVVDGWMHIRCVNDVKEQEIFKNLDDLIAKNLNSDGTSGNNLKKLFASLSIYLINNLSFKDLLAQTIDKHKNQYILKNYFAFQSIPDPPPKQSFGI